MSAPMSPGANWLSAENILNRKERNIKASHRSTEVAQQLYLRTTRLKLKSPTIKAAVLYCLAIRSANDGSWRGLITFLQVALWFVLWISNPKDGNLRPTSTAWLLLLGS